jgi:hypothetical protein
MYVISNERVMAKVMKRPRNVAWAKVCESADERTSPFLILRIELTACRDHSALTDNSRLGSQNLLLTHLLPDLSTW